MSMSHTQHIFRHILSNENLLENFKASYDTADLQRMFQLTDEEADELNHFVQNTDTTPDGYHR